MVKSTDKTIQPANTGMFVEKTLAAVASVSQDTPTQHDVEREERRDQTRTKPGPTPNVFVSFRRSEPIEHYKPFAEALRAAMNRAGMTASEVARIAWGPSKTGKGARNRDRLSHYLAGTQYPEPENLQKIADALGVPVEEFVLPPRDNPGPRSRPAVGDMHASTVPDQPGMMRLQLDRIIPARLALEIMAMLTADQTAGVAHNSRLGDVVAGTDTQNNGTK